MKERIGTAGKIAAASTLGLFILSGESTGDPFAIPELAADYLQETPRIVVNFLQSDECNRTTSQNRLYVEGLMLKDDPFSPESPTDTHEQAMISATRYNLHLVDETQYYQMVDESGTFDEVLDILNQYAKFHSLSFSIPSEVELRDYPIRYSTANPGNISLEEIKTLSKKILSALYFIPTEVTNFSNVNEIKLVNRIKIPAFVKSLKGTGNGFIQSLDKIRKEDNDPIGIFNPITRNIFIGINEQERNSIAYILKHEISHGVLFNYCGLFGSIDDEELEGVNPDGFVYSDIDSLHKFPQVTPSEYGYESVYEDAAFITGGYIFSNNRVSLNALSNTQRGKIFLLIARINQVIPGFADYWKETKLE